MKAVKGISSILLVSSPPDNLKKAFIEDSDLTLAATLISKAVEAFARLIDFVIYEPADEPPSTAVSSTKSTVLVTFAIILEPLAGAVTIVSVVPETV